jgi:arginase family enzyme
MGQQTDARRRVESLCSVVNAYLGQGSSVVHSRILDLDGSTALQTGLRGQQNLETFDLRRWGQFLRMACSFRRFAQFEAALAEALGCAADSGFSATFIGSGDFHHVSLALLRRIRQPFNLLVLDNHPDWMRGIPFLHCGSWVRHALKLPQLKTIFHVGGDVDFDNHYRWLAPWHALRSHKIRVVSAVRRFERGRWMQLAAPALRYDAHSAATPRRIALLVDAYRAELSQFPLYISLDKDVMTATEAPVNWDSGHLTFSEVLALLEGFIVAAKGRLAGMDVVGDWSPVQTRGLGRKLLHLTEHPRLNVQPTEAARQHQNLNLQLLEGLRRWMNQQPIPEDIALEV